MAKYVLVEKSVISFISCLCFICEKFAGNASVFQLSRFLIVYVGGFVVSEKTTTSDTGARHISNLRG